MPELDSIGQNTRDEINLLVDKQLFPDFRGALARAAGKCPDYFTSEEDSCKISKHNFAPTEYSIYLSWMDGFRYKGPTLAPRAELRIKAFLHAKGLWNDGFSPAFTERDSSLEIERHRKIPWWSMITEKMINREKCRD